MPRSTFVNQDFVLTVLAVYAATVAFNRWFPEANLVAVEAHPSSYIQTFKSVPQSALTLYAVHLVVDIIRVMALAVLESAAFSFAFIDDVFEPFSYAFLVFSLIITTKDILMLGCIQAFPEVNDLAAAKVAELMPLAVMMEQGLLAAGALALAKGLYSWTYAIGRDKRQVIEKEDLKKNE
ncbi:hypothetical protein BC939DRAFT_439542 [Gamsiella multidivaricata]|uniref:uncharacterized protein n=1 Tax=Gamsiella multidivaricata TaxID=101098 RepID=UPI002220B06E|nr:uncharacterized protein BC939DRAFT_439542 [Gamsiella multidivaricata]KAI7830497.1 hypothetical protein BC939DRAFT_439542 [Gamsiella multidivaricata]